MIVSGATNGNHTAEKILRGMWKAACMREAGSMMRLPATAVLPGGLNGFGRGTQVTCYAFSELPHI